MVRFVLVAFCATVVLAAGANAKALSSGDLGIIMSTRAYEAVCWYETLKIFPETNTKGYMSCGGQAQQQQDAIENPDDGMKTFFEQSSSNPDVKPQTFGQFMGDAMTGIPSDYKDACGQYLTDIKAAPQSDESDALFDNNKDMDYPLKAFAYCMMSTLRQRQGDGAINAVKNEITHTKKNWEQAMLDRDNEFRARHGSPPLTRNSELDKAAQQWADQQAKECKMYHTKNDDPRRQYRGEGTGESISSGSTTDDKTINGYISSDGWYEENKNYPYPEYKEADDPDGAQFSKIGHFTQSVWKGSKQVGYGYKYNKDCPGQKFYIAARYYPAGNGPGEFGVNVAPPQ